MRNLYGTLAVVVWILFSGSFASATATLNYHGRIVKPNGLAFEPNSATIKIQIRSTGAEDCLMWEETYSGLDMSGTGGVFSLNLNSSTGVRTDGSGLTFAQVFGNYPTTTMTVPMVNCTGGSNVITLTSSSHRVARLLFKDSVMPSFEQTPDMAIAYVPFSMDSQKVGGFTPDNLLRVEDASGPQAAAAFSPVEFAELQALIGGSSGQYEKSGELNGQTIPALSNGNVLQWQGGAWTAVTPVTSESDPNTRAYAKADLPTCAANEFLQSTGANTWVCTGVTGAAGGTVTSITVGSGLVDGSGSTGTSILTTGTIALPDLITAGTGTKVTFDAKGRITSTTTLAEADIPNLTAAGKVSGDTITSGTIAGTTAINTSGNILGGEVSTSSLVLRDGDTNKITIQTPADVTANYVLTLPPDNGGAGEVLTTDGNGVLTWVPFSTGSVTSISGTLPITVGGTASVPVIAVNSATTTTTGVVTLAADGGTTASTVVQATDSRLTNSRAPSGTASGDLDGTYPGPTVAKIQGFAVDTATPLDTQVMRYTGGGTNKWAPAYINFADLKKADGTPQVVGATCTAGQTMIWSSITDLFTCTTISLTAAQISDVDTTLAKIGGNTVTGTMVLGANSTHNLQFETDGAARMTIDSSGNVGIGTTAPTSNFVVESDGSINSISSGAYGTGVWGQLLLFTKRGTQATPTATQSGDILGSINFQGHDTGGSNGAIIRGVAAAEWGTAGDSTDAPANIQFLTGPDGTQGPLERMVITSTGSVGIGTSAPGTSLDVVGAITSGPLGTASGETGQFILRELAANGSHSAKIRAPDSLAADYTLTLPVDDGNVGEVLTTNGSGVLTWSPASAATSVVANIGSAAAPSIAFSGDANTGIFSPGAEQVAIAANGAQIFNFSSGGMTSPTTGGGTVTTASGTASAPTFSFTGDEDTGWYRATANTLAAATDGTERVRIDSAGNVGIGINNPSAKLDVNKSIATDGTQQRATNVKMDVSAGTNITSSSFTGTNIDIATSAPGQISSVTGSEVWSRVNPAGGVALMRGYYANLYNYDAVPVDYWNGAELSLYNGGGGATNQMNGVNVNLSQNNSSTMNAAVGFLANINNNNSSTMNEAIGFRVEFANNANIGVGTGLYIDATGASVGRGIYQVGVADKNIFMGDIGVGTDTPTTKLDVAGAITSRPHGTATGETGQFIMRELAANGVNTATIRVPDSIAADYILTLPADDGNSGEVLTTNGSGVLTWAAAGSATSVAAGAGSAAAPSMSFSGDPNTGFYNTAADQIGVAANGAQIFNFSSSGLKSPTTGGATITTADGTAAAPTFSFTGDEDTGWFRPAADTLAASTAGTERVRIDSNGRVGIGTTSPAAKLDVMAYNINVGADWSTGTARTDATGKGGYVTFPHYTNAQAPITMIGSLNSATSNGVFIGGGTSNYNAATSISFYTAANSTTNTGTERMRIESSGHVGIGTTGPQALLHTEGSTNAALESMRIVNLNSGSSAHSLFRFFNDAGSTGAGIYMNSSARTAEAGASGLGLYNDVGSVKIRSKNNDIGFLTGSSATEKMTILNNGNIGMGNTSPVARLDIVRPSSNPGVTITATNGATTFTTSASVTLNAGDYIYPLTSTGQARFVAAGGGGTGTSFTVTPAFTADVTGEGFTINPPALRVDTNKLFVAGNGNVGIGTVSPAAPSVNNGIANLDVVGSGRFFRQLQINSAGSFPQQSSLQFTYSGTDYARIQTDMASSGVVNSDLSFWTSSSSTISESMRINSLGRVGIGTDTPGTRLDVVGAITSRPYGTATGNTGQFIMRELAANGVNTATIRVPDALAADYVLTLPVDDGNSGEVLTTNGSGVLSWAAAGSATSVAAGAGTAAAPSMSFSGDPNTGFYSAGADQIGMAANGANIFTMDATGITAATTGGGLVKTGNGSAATPTFSFAGDPDTGWFRPAADTLAAATAGTERVRIVSNAFGIGTTGPNIGGASGNFTVTSVVGPVGGILELGGATNTATGGSSIGTVNFYNGTVRSAEVGSWTAGTDSGVLRFSTKPAGSAIAERMRIDENGNVGIGTTTSSGLLDIYSTGGRYQTFPANGRVLFQDNDNNVAPALTLTNTYDTAGHGVSLSLNLGYGGTGGLVGTPIVGARVSAISENTYTSTASTQDASLQFMTATDGTLGERMRITSGGNVGIGTNAPADLVEIYKAATNGLQIPLRLRNADNNNTGGTSTAIGFRAGTTNSGSKGLIAFERTASWGRGKLHFILNDTADTADATLAESKMTIDTNGYVGIGTNNPVRLLDVSSADTTTTSIGIVNSSAGGRAYTIGSTGSANAAGAGNFYIYDANSSAFRMLINSSGKVGIGSSSPTTALDVNGVVKATGFEGPMTPSSVNVVGAGGGAVAAIRIEDPNTAAGGFPQLILRDRAPASADDEIWSMRSGDGGNLGFGTLDNAEASYSEKFSILRNGNVGIGTTNPNYALTVNGSVVAGPGAAAGPAYMFYPTATYGATGMYAPAANSVGLVTSGVERFRIDSSGNVGVGTSAPAAKFHVSGPTDANYGTLQLGNAAANGYYSQVANNANYLDLIANGDQSYRANVVGDNVGTGHIRFFTAHATTGNTERMRISSVGNVGIGTLNPTYRMEVSSTGGTDTLGGHFSGTGTGLTYLDVRSDNTADTSGALIRLISKDVADSSVTSVDLVKYNNGLFAISNNETNSAAATVFNMGGSEKMRLTSTGALGIGVSPLVGLHLKYDAGTTGISQWIERPTQAKNNFLGFQTSGSNTNQWVIGNDDSSDDMSIWSTAGSGSWTPWMTIKNTTGNVGIGTSTVNAKLQVQGDISTGDGGVKWKTYSGTTPGGAYNFSFAHGLSADKIVSINCMVRYGASVYAPFSFVAIGSSRYVTADTTNINIYYDSDANWLSNPYRCIVQYVP